MKDTPQTSTSLPSDIANHYRGETVDQDTFLWLIKILPPEDLEMLLFGSNPMKIRFHNDIYDQYSTCLSLNSVFVHSARADNIRVLYQLITRTIGQTETRQQLLQVFHDHLDTNQTILREENSGKVLSALTNDLPDEIDSVLSYSLLGEIFVNDTLFLNSVLLKHLSCTRACGLAQTNTLHEMLYHFIAKHHTVSHYQDILERVSFILKDNIIAQLKGPTGSVVTLLLMYCPLGKRDRANLYEHLQTHRFDVTEFAMLLRHAPDSYMDKLTNSANFNHHLESINFIKQLLSTLYERLPIGDIPVFQPIVKTSYIGSVFTPGGLFQYNQAQLLKRLQKLARIIVTRVLRTPPENIRLIELYDNVKTQLTTRMQSLLRASIYRNFTQNITSFSDLLLLLDSLSAKEAKRALNHITTAQLKQFTDRDSSNAVLQLFVEVPQELHITLLRNGLLAILSAEQFIPHYRCLMHTLALDAFSVFIEGNQSAFTKQLLLTNSTIHLSLILATNSNFYHNAPQDIAKKRLTLFEICEELILCFFIGDNAPLTEAAFINLLKRYLVMRYSPNQTWLKLECLQTLFQIITHKRHEPPYSDYVEYKNDNLIVAWWNSITQFGFDNPLSMTANMNFHICCLKRLYLAITAEGLQHLIPEQKNQMAIANPDTLIDFNRHAGGEGSTSSRLELNTLLR